MTSNLQLNQLITSLNGEPLAVSPAYWQAFESELSTLANTITGAEIDRRREAVAARLMSASGSPAGGVQVNLNNSSSTPKKSIAHLQLTGLMLSQDFLWIRGVNHLTAELTAADSNPNIAAVLLEVNSGGGMVTAGQMLAATIEGMSKPVIVFTHFMASAAIMGTLPANKIVASSPGVEVGSIGTMLKVDKVAAEVERTRYLTIYADKSTKKNHAHRSALRGDYQPLTQKVNQVNKMFLAAVKEHRILKGDVNGTLSGEMFMAAEAKQRGLIDDIGGYQKALIWINHCLKFKERPGRVARLQSRSTTPQANPGQRVYLKTPMSQKISASLAGRKK